ncbi:MAG: GerMN domain-containing protein, partial [Actinobacteria bacterium]|nr:GerMN domain-containing protein [Actinomycetota bacterium]
YEDNTAYLAPETRTLPAGGDLYKKIVEEIIRGPVGEQAYPVLPSDVKVNSVDIENGLATVDFSKEIITNSTEIPHSSTTEILAIFSIVDTLTEFEEIQKVRITVDGRQSGQIDGLYIEDFWGHVGIYEDFSRNEQILIKGSGM